MRNQLLTPHAELQTAQVSDCLPDACMPVGLPPPGFPAASLRNQLSSRLQLRQDCTDWWHWLMAQLCGSCVTYPLTRQGCWRAELQDPGTATPEILRLHWGMQMEFKVGAIKGSHMQVPARPALHAGLWEDHIPDHDPAPSSQGYRGRCEPGGDCWRGGCGAGLCHGCHSGRAGGRAAGVMAGCPFCLLAPQVLLCVNTL